MNGGVSRDESGKELTEEERIKAAYARRLGGEIYSMFNPGNLFMCQERERWFIKLFSAYGLKNLETKKILEVGCGAGYWVREFIKWGAQPENITGIDLLPERIDKARHLCPGSVTLFCTNAEVLEFATDSFDLVLQSTVFTSILDEQVKQRIAAEMVRVLRPDGLLLWYDYHFNNPRNPDVRGVKKPEIYRLFAGCHIRLQRITLAPPLSRLLAPYSPLLCHLLGKLPFLCTHYLGAIKKHSH